MAAGFQSCSDISDVKPFYPKRHLYLKPLLKINISIQLPSLKLVGKSISNVTLMEHIRNWASPDKFCTVKVTKSTLEFIRFEADLLNPSKVQAILARLDGKQITLAGFKEIVKVRASIAKSDFPTRHDWDSFFRDAKHMNEMKPGERPDTLHLSDLPNKWFSTKSKEDLPSESLLKKIFQQFGEVTAVDIPSVDPYRSKMKAHLSGLKLFNFNQNTTFEAYVQYRDYISFVKAMDYLRGMKLLKIESDKSLATNIKVDFDKTKHLSENSIRKRKIEREKLMAKDRELEEKKQKLEDALKKLDENEDEKVVEKEAILVRKETKRDKRRKKSQEDCCCGDGREEEEVKIMNEKKLLFAAQRKLESIRILTELLRLIKEQKESHKMEASSVKDVIKRNSESRNDVEDNLSSTEIRLQGKEETELPKTDCNEEVNRLHSEVVKVDRSASDHRNKKNEVQIVFSNKRNGLSLDSRRWKRRQWSGGNRSNGRGGLAVNPSYNQNNPDYYRHTHHLYYKYFQSITRNGPIRTSKSRSNSSSKSGKHRDHYSRSRSLSRLSSSSRSRSRSFKRNSPYISRRTRSRSYNRVKSGRSRPRSYSNDRSISRNNRKLN